MTNSSSTFGSSAKPKPVNPTNKFRAKKSGSAYENMVILRRDLYYKEIVHANAARVEAGTEFIIKDILWRYKRNFISKKELFNELEGLRSGYACTDVPVKTAIKAIRAKK